MVQRRRGICAALCCIPARAIVECGLRIKVGSRCVITARVVADAAGLARSCKTSCPRLIVVRGGVLAHIVPEHTRNHVGTDLTSSEKHLDKIVGRRVAAHKGHRFTRGECDADYELDERVEGLPHEWVVGQPPAGGSSVMLLAVKHTVSQSVSFFTVPRRAHPSTGSQSGSATPGQRARSPDPQARGPLSQWTEAWPSSVMLTCSAWRGCTDRQLCRGPPRAHHRLTVRLRGVSALGAALPRDCTARSSNCQLTTRQTRI